MSEKLRESINSVEIEGYLNKKDLKLGETKTDGQEYISGKIEVRVGESNIVPVEVFAKKLKKDGGENAIYKGLLTVLNEFKAADEVSSIEEATKVRISNGRVTVQDFVSKKNNNELSYSVKYNTNFVNRVTDDTFEPKAKFELEVVVNSFKAETNRDGEETGRGSLEGYFIDFMGNIKPVNFKIGAGKMWSKFEDKAEKGDTIIFRCDIIEDISVTTKVIESDFGDDEVKVIRRTVKERVARNASYVEENAYDVKDIKDALKSRTEYLEGLKNKALFDGKNNAEDEDKLW